MKTHRIPEAFLHFLWKTRRFDHQALRTTHGEFLEVLDAGQHNRHAGPDFLQARIRIGRRLWAGQVEIHVRASDWIAHKHPFDPAYQNVVLHVVWEEDRPIYLADGSRLPCLELKDRTPVALLAQYRRLQQSRLKVPCTSRLAEVSSLTRSAWLDRMLAERMELQAQKLADVFERTQSDWEQSLRVSVARAMGLPANADAMQELMLRLPHTLLARYRDNPARMEALFFGQAGLLQGAFRDDWPRELQKNYRFLQRKHGLKPLQALHWKWSRMRPASFPSLRIAQLAALCSKHASWFSAFRQMKSVDEIKAFFKLQTSDYWTAHHHWQRPSAGNLSQPGKELVERVVLNALAPLFFFYGQQSGDPAYQQRALHWLHQLPAENNRITRMWRDLGWDIKSAEHSQGILHLQRTYCERRRCLECAVGHALLKGS